MILDPVNDRQCLGLATDKVRQWARSAFAHTQAARYENTAELAAAIRAEPQLDDTGRGHAHVLACDERVRFREDPRNPNCVERAAWYLAAAEVIDPSMERSLGTFAVTLADGTPARHTNAFERVPGGQWEPVLLQPDAAPIGHRNASAGEITGDVFTVVHPIGQAVVDYYLGPLGPLVGGALGSAESAGIGNINRNDQENAAADKAAADKAAADKTAADKTAAAGKKTAAAAAATMAATPAAKTNATQPRSASTWAKPKKKPK